MKLSDVLTESARQRPRRALPAGDGRNDIVPDDNQCADEQESSDQIEEAYFAKSLGSSKVLRMNGDLEEPTPSSERFDIGSPCRARDEQSAHEEQYSPEQEEQEQYLVHDPCFKWPTIAGESRIVRFARHSGCNRRPKLRLQPAEKEASRSTNVRVRDGENGTNRSG